MVPSLPVKKTRFSLCQKCLTSYVSPCSFVPLPRASTSSLVITLDAMSLGSTIVGGPPRLFGAILSDALFEAFDHSGVVCASNTMASESHAETVA
jgi:hypothetical protein